MMDRLDVTVDYLLRCVFADQMPPLLNDGEDDGEGDDGGDDRGDGGGDGGGDLNKFLIELHTRR